VKTSQVLSVLSFVGLAVATASAPAQSAAPMAATYVLTITNGSQMPLSPPIIYARDGAESAAPIGALASPGFTEVCKSGGTATRLAELQSAKDVANAAVSAGMVFPGESRVVEITVPNPRMQSLHLEAMYGKTKDVCAVGTVNAHTLTALKQHASSEYVGLDQTVLTGTFTNPALPAGMTYLDPSVCPTAKDAISCLRELSTEQSPATAARFFSGYSPTLVSALEAKYGFADVQTLLFPTSGAIQLKLKLKH
jgi:hypothetical protein